MPSTKSEKIKAIEWKYGGGQPGVEFEHHVDSNGDIVFDRWVHPNEGTPNSARINQVVTEWKTTVDTPNKNARKGRKQSVLSKMGLSKADIPALMELISDGNDD